MGRDKLGLPIGPDFQPRLGRTGRRASVTYPSVLGGMSVNYAYDALGTLRQLEAANQGNGGNTDALTFTLTNDSVGPAGRILHQRMECDGVQSDGNPCGGTSAVRATANEYNRPGWLVEQAINIDVDLMRYDASGNLRWKQHTTWNPDSFYVAPQSNRVSQVFEGDGDTLAIYYELDGSRRSEWSPITATRAYFYDGRGRTSGIRSWVQLPGLSWQFIGNPENCGYDPLGRQFRACASAAPLLAFDGDNIVRAQNWSLAQGPGLDDPLVSLLHPYTGGEFELFYVTDGNGRHYAVGDKDGLLDLEFLASDMYAGWDATGGGQREQYVQRRPPGEPGGTRAVLLPEPGV